MIKVEGQVNLDGRGWQAGLRQIDSSTTALAGKMGGALKAQVASLFAVGAITAAAKATIEYGGRINDLAARAGVSAEAIQGMGYAAQQNSSDLETLVGFFEKVGEARAKALGGDMDALANFESLGVSSEDLRTKRADQIGITIANTVRDGDIQQLIAPLKSIGGKGAASLVAAFKDGIENKMQEAKDAGLIISEAAIGELDTVGDRLDTLGVQLKTGLAPAVLVAANAVQAMLDQIRIFSAYASGLTSTLNAEDIITSRGGLVGEGGIVGDFMDMFDLHEFNYKLSKIGNLDASGFSGVIGDLIDGLSNPDFDGFVAKRKSVVGTLASSLGSASTLADIEAQKIRDEIAAREKSLAEKKNPNPAYAFEASVKADKASKQKSLPDIPSDSFVRVGNFLGSSGRSVLETLGQKQYEEAKKATALLNDIRNELKLGLGDLLSDHF